MDTQSTPVTQHSTLVQLPGAPITCPWCGKRVRIALRHSGGLRCLCGAELPARKAARCPRCGEHKNHGDWCCDRCYWADDALDLEADEPVPFYLTSRALALLDGVPYYEDPEPTDEEV